jgi:hypothetical protein
MHDKGSFWMVLRSLPLDRNAVAAGSGCGIRAGHEESGVAAMLYGRYHGQILGLAIRSGADGGWRARLREILAEFDNDCRDLSRSYNRLLRRELATQIEQEVLRFADPDKQAVLGIALKHFDSL